MYSDDLELVFAELPKFTQKEDDLQDISDKWYYFLKHADDLEAVPATFKQDAPIMHAFELARKSALTANELEDQERREIYIQDQRGAIQLAQSRGLQQGLQKGRLEVRHQMLVQAYKSGMTYEAIADVFQMDVEDVKAMVDKEVS